MSERVWKRGREEKRERVSDSREARTRDRQDK